MLHEETDGGTAGAAAEAVIELLIGIDVERRGLLAMKGTQGLVAATNLPERQVGVDHLDDVHPRQQLVDEGFGDTPGRHLDSSRGEYRGVVNRYRCTAARKQWADIVGVPAVSSRPTLF